MNEKTILFLDPGNNPNLKKVVHRALVASGSKVMALDSADAASKELGSGHVQLVLINYDEADEPCKSLVTELLEKRQEIPTVLLSQKKDKNHLISLFSHERLRNLIARNDKVNEHELIITTEKLLRQDLFGLDKYLVWGVNIVKEPLVDSAEKGAHVARVGKFVEGLGCDRRFIRLAETVTDELLMNAFFDAPIGKDGKPMYAHLPRTERIRLEGDQQGLLEYGSDGRHFAVACRDRFGALEAKTVVSYLRKCFLQDDHQVDTKAGGAGVGFYMIFQSMNQLVINIEPGKFTETIGIIDIQNTYRDTKSRSKSFNIFLKQAGSR